MPLDPQLQPILDLLGGELQVEGLSPEEVRSVSDGGITPRDETGLAAVEDIKVAGADGMLPARVYRPEGVPAPSPVVVFFHGGGWTIGSIESHDSIAARIAAESKCTVVSVEYRLAPEHKFPEPLEDCYAATAYVAEHAGELGVDASRLAVFGDSAGGNLAAVVCLLARERGGPPIRAQALVYPACDLSMSYPSMAENGALGYLLSDTSIRWFTNHYIGGCSNVDWRASPLDADDLSGLPPALVVTAELDPLRDEGEAYAARLQDAGVSVTAIRADGECHGFFSFPIDEAIRVRGVVAEWLAESLR
jgi:acetyl esterase